ncbi:hypothetical protein NDU88_007202 [Pleurodeles waltl]|uniref:Uncharacterized protein n=1 Tax=Pleurodeles waltl TaxID=8319 RepID=A0AAV7LSW0_PLEWA|nr:hypothetical protein NDU88_007202 [Pleurodeles waltl]
MVANNILYTPGQLDHQCWYLPCSSAVLALRLPIVPAESPGRSRGTRGDGLDFAAVSGGLTRLDHPEGRDALPAMPGDDAASGIGC